MKNASRRSRFSWNLLATKDVFLLWVANYWLERNTFYYFELDLNTREKMTFQGCDRRLSVTFFDVLQKKVVCSSCAHLYAVGSTNCCGECSIRRKKPTAKNECLVANKSYSRSGSRSDSKKHFLRTWISFTICISTAMNVELICSRGGNGEGGKTPFFAREKEERWDLRTENPC